MAKIVNCTECLKNKLYKFYKKTLAFTLAETLIVMGVIGVVAALTLPNLNQSTGNKEKIVKVKKMYQNLNDAFGRATAIYGPMDEWSDTVDTFYNRMTEFMKLSKSDFANKKVITADGTSIYFQKAYIHSYVMTIDIDGDNKGKNSLGYDRFYFEAQRNELKPFNYPEFEAFCDTFALMIKNKMMCGSAWIIYYDTMDYLKFDNNGKRPNNTTVTESNPRCN